MKKKEEIIDLTNPQETFEQIDKMYQLLTQGFLAFAMDYNHYIESTFLHKGDEKHRIYELRDSVMYRFKSAKFHLLLLLRQRNLISIRFENMLKEDPRVFSGFFMGNPYFDRAQDEIMAIYDSIIFHLSSSFDYLSILINYNFGKQKENPLKWIQLARSCRDSKSEYFNKSFAEKIDEVDRNFISKFNEYRTELIHRKNSESYALVNWKLPTGEVNARFVCSPKLAKTFKNTIDKEGKNTIAFLSSELILKSILITGEVLLAIKDEFRKNYTIADNIKKGAPAIGYFDPKTKQIMSPGEEYWKGFETEIKNVLQQRLNRQ